MMKKILEVSTILNVMFDKICVIEKQLCPYICGTWKHIELGNSERQIICYSLHIEILQVLCLLEWNQ